MTTALIEAPAIAKKTGPRSVSSRPKPDVTPEKLLKMPDGDIYELIDGKLVEKPMGAESSKIGVAQNSLIRSHVHSQRQGSVYGPDCQYQAFPEKPTQVRKPDGSFIVKGRRPEEKSPKGYMTIAPDWAGEVVSPKDRAEEIEARRVDFMKAGTRLFWIIYPEHRTVHVFRKDGSHSVLTEGDNLSGEDVIPGFTCKVAELFEDL